MAQKDLQYGARTIRRILRELEHPADLEHKYAQALLAQAVSNAAGRPTPQAPMAAANLVVEGSTIGPLTGGAPAEVAIGSEFGSVVYPQFQKPPNPRGYWLYPAAEDVRVVAETDKALEDTLDRIIRNPF